MNQLEIILPRIISLMKETGSFIREQSGKISQNDIETKSLNSLVTFVDKTAEEQLVSGLKAILPESVFLTEEKTTIQSDGEWQWIIDPLDGTTNFIHAVPVFSISIALTHQSEIVLGVVYEINRDECFSAIKGKGAFLNGTPIYVSKTQHLSDSLIATGFPYYDFDRIDFYVETLRHLMQNTRGIRRLGSAAVDLCYTACGRFDAFFEYSLSPWDVAAGGLILWESGGIVTDFKGGNNWLFGREIVGGNPKLMPDLLALLSR